MKKNEQTIWVYTDWESSGDPQLMGILTAQRIRGKEIFSFEYNESRMTTNQEVIFLDPNLGF